jgi:hypothetical protein
LVYQTAPRLTIPTEHNYNLYPQEGYILAVVKRHSFTKKIPYYVADYIRVETSPQQTAIRAASDGTMRRFTRLTSALSKKVDNLRWSVAFHFMHYNFCGVHQTLRVVPAMAAGIANHTGRLTRPWNCSMAKLEWWPSAKPLNGLLGRVLHAQWTLENSILEFSGVPGNP